MSDQPEVKLKSVHGSASAFAFNGVVYTDSASGCLRKILLDAHQVRTPFPEHIALIGAKNEERWQGEKLGDTASDYEREMVVKEPIPGFPGAQFSGRIDFYMKVENEPHELKSISSKNVHKKVIVQGKYKTNNLAQVVSYMIAKESPRGKLIYTSYVDPELPLDRVFHVEFGPGGSIIVDGIPSQFTIRDQLEHRFSAAKVATENIVWPDRPFDWESKFESPCKWCDWKLTCLKFDAGEVTTPEEFVDSAKQELELILNAKESQV